MLFKNLLTLAKRVQHRYQAWGSASTGMLVLPPSGPPVYQLLRGKIWILFTFVSSALSIRCLAPSRCSVRTDRTESVVIRVQWPWELSPDSPLPLCSSNRVKMDLGTDYAPVECCSATQPPSCSRWSNTLGSSDSRPRLQVPFIGGAASPWLLWTLCFLPSSFLLFLCHFYQAHRYQVCLLIFIVFFELHSFPNFIFHVTTKQFISII